MYSSTLHMECLNIYLLSLLVQTVSVSVRLQMDKSVCAKVLCVLPLQLYALSLLVRWLCALCACCCGL